MPTSSDKSDDQHPRFGIQTCVKDEQHILVEWISHHLLLGFDHIFIYDDNSSPSVLETISMSGALQATWLAHVTVIRLDFDFFSESCLKKSLLFDEVLYTTFPTRKQLYLMNHFCRHVAPQSLEWCLFIDADEFLWPKDANWRLCDLVENLQVDFVRFRWLMFGTSMRVDQDPDLLSCEQLIWHGDEYHQHEVKTLARMSAIRSKLFFDLHRLLSHLPFLELVEPTSKLFEAPVHINHYYCNALRTMLRRKLRPMLGEEMCRTYHPERVLSFAFNNNRSCKLLPNFFVRTRALREFMRLPEVCLKSLLEAEVGRSENLCSESLFFDNRIISRHTKMPVDYQLLHSLLKSPHVRYATWQEMSLPKDFCSRQYRRLNPDLASVGNDAGLKAHFVLFGRQEGRLYALHGLPYDFDPDMYRLLNPDLKALGDVELEKHYVTRGRSENRIYMLSGLPEDFCPDTYKLLNPDLTDMNTAELQKHFVLHGAGEGRRYALETTTSLSVR